MNDLQLDHQQVQVTETPDNPVVRRLDLQETAEPIRAELVKHRIGLAILGAMLLKLNVGGPPLDKVALAAIEGLGLVGSLIVSAALGAIGIIAALRGH